MPFPEVAYGDNLALLSDLTENTLLEEIRIRYERNIIYTYLGDILLAVNPNKDLPIYGQEVGLKYTEAKQLKELAPHVYAVACRAYRNLTWAKVNQCVLVSGESGAGKTETTKMMVAQIARMSTIDPSSGMQRTESPSKLHEQIVEINPLLEAFGNAKTSMNDNSSRFGKLIEVIFSKDGSIMGAQVTEHMLEKSRVVHTGQGERSFHIFYYMFAGLSEGEIQRYFLTRPEHYRIIDPGHGLPVFHSQMDFDKHRFGMEELKEIMTNTGFSVQLIDMLMAMMAGILHLSNVEFAPDPELQQVIIVNEEEIDYGSRLLSLQAEDLVTVLLATTNFIRGERVMKLKSVVEACDGRDALVKSLYSRIFSWIVRKINDVLHVKDGGRRHVDRGIISMLDMAGFENFQYNSFEQLCINSANEQLQNYFNTYIFSWELQEYVSEGIKQPKIKFTNNKDVLGLLFDRPCGIFSILEDECRLQTSTGLSFVENMNKEFAKNVVYKKAKSRDAVFTVIHYAGQVVYHAHHFIEKNRETLGTNFISLMQNSHNWLINDLFDENQRGESRINDRVGDSWTVPEWNQPNMPTLGPGETLSKRAGKKIKQKINRDRPLPAPPTGTSTSVHFRNSLTSLMEKLKTCEPQFIRCVKANAEKQFGFFDAKLVQDQLRNTGVFETTRIRRIGFPTRLLFQDFINRYKVLGFPVTAPVETSGLSCRRILAMANIFDCEIGHSKVFLKYWHVDHLNMCLENYLANLKIVQRTIQMYLARTRFLSMMKYSLQCRDNVFSLATFVTKYSDKINNMLVSSDDHDKHLYQKKIQEQKRQQSRYQQRRLPRHRSDYDDDTRYYNADNDRRAYDNYRREPESMYYRPNEPLYASEITYTRGRPVSNIYEECLQQLYSKWRSIDPDAWCKIIYMEYDKIVAKCYVLERELTIDGSYEEFDGERIGLSVFRNPDRDEIIERTRSFIGKGVKLRKDTDGSITATRLGKNNVIVKGHDEPSEHCFSTDVLNNEGKLPHNMPTKIFDMEEYKCQIGIQMKRREVERRFLGHHSITSLSFVEDHYQASQTPCWIIIINLSALRAVDDPHVKAQVEQKIAELANRTEEEQVKEIEKQELAERNKHRRWSKLDPRQGVKGSEAPLRKTRLDLMKKGKTVGENLSYSWDIESNSSNRKVRNVSDLQEQIEEQYEEPISQIGGYKHRGRTPSVMSSVLYDPTSPVRRDWAKVKVAMRQESVDDKLQGISEVDEF